jgi:hypothetical protein
MVDLSKSQDMALGFTGTVDVSAAQAQIGSVFTRSDEIRIVNGNGA